MVPYAGGALLVGGQTLQGAPQKNVYAFNILTANLILERTS